MPQIVYAQQLPGNWQNNNLNLTGAILNPLFTELGQGIGQEVRHGLFGNSPQEDFMAAQAAAMQAKADEPRRAAYREFMASNPDADPRQAAMQLGLTGIDDNTAADDARLFVDPESRLKGAAQVSAYKQVMGNDPHYRAAWSGIEAAGGFSPATTKPLFSIEGGSSALPPSSASSGPSATLPTTGPGAPGPSTGAPTPIAADPPTGSPPVTPGKTDQQLNAETEAKLRSAVTTPPRVDSPLSDDTKRHAAVSLQRIGGSLQALGQIANTQYTPETAAKSSMLYSSTDQLLNSMVNKVAQDAGWGYRPTLEDVVGLQAIQSLSDPVWKQAARKEDVVAATNAANTAKRRWDTLGVNDTDLQNIEKLRGGLGLEKVNASTLFNARMSFLKMKQMEQDIRLKNVADTRDGDLHELKKVAMALANQDARTGVYVNQLLAEAKPEDIALSIDGKRTDIMEKLSRIGVNKSTKDLNHISTLMALHDRHYQGQLNTYVKAWTAEENAAARNMASAIKARGDLLKQQTDLTKELGVTFDPAKQEEIRARLATLQTEIGTTETLISTMKAKPSPGTESRETILANLQARSQMGFDRLMAAYMDSSPALKQRPLLDNVADPNYYHGKTSLFGFGPDGKLVDKLPQSPQVRAFVEVLSKHTATPLSYADFLKVPFKDGSGNPQTTDKFIDASAPKGQFDWERQRAYQLYRDLLNYRRNKSNGSTQ